MIIFLASLTFSSVSFRSLNTTDDSGCTALHHAARQGLVQVVFAILARPDFTQNSWAWPTDGQQEAVTRATSQAIITAYVEVALCDGKLEALRRRSSLRPWEDVVLSWSLTNRRLAGGQQRGRSSAGMGAGRSGILLERSLEVNKFLRRAWSTMKVL